MDRNKNCSTIIKVAKSLIEDGWDVKLTVVGKVIDRKREKVIHDAPFAEHIHPVKKEKLIDIYRDNDIFVMPSFGETFGLVYVEAMSQGLPVIYTKGQGFDGQFPEGEVGYHVLPDSVESVKDAVLTIIDRYEQISIGISEKANEKSFSACLEKHPLWHGLGEKQKLRGARI